MLWRINLAKAGAAVAVKVFVFVEREINMVSRLEQAIACGVLPETVDIRSEVLFFGIETSDKKYWVGYKGWDAVIGSSNDRADYFATLDEAVEALIPILWAEIKILDGDNRKSYEEYCLELVYEPMVRPATLVLEIKELGVAIQAELCEGWLEKYEQQLEDLRIQRIKELCANGDRVSLPSPFDNVEY